MTPPAAAGGSYSLENARKFGWSSVSGDLHPERRAHLETYVLGPRVLDAGCGGGGFVHFLCECGFEGFGIDRHEQFLRVARDKGFEGRFVQGDLTCLPFADDTFDTTFCFDVLEHVDDQAALRELARVTCKRLILAVPQEDEVMTKFKLTFSHYQDKTHLRNYTPSSLEALAARVRPANVHIFPELFIPARELVLEMLVGGLEPLRQQIEEALALDLPPLPPLVLDAAVEPQLPAGVPLRRVRARIARTRAVRQAYAEAYQAAYEQAWQRYRETIRDTLYTRVVQWFLDESSYREIPTGLVAVLDL